jgi:hypothetical protein
MAEKQEGKQEKRNPLEKVGKVLNEVGKIESEVESSTKTHEHYGAICRSDWTQIYSSSCSL